MKESGGDDFLELMEKIMNLKQRVESELAKKLRAEGKENLKQRVERHIIGKLEGLVEYNKNLKQRVERGEKTIGAIHGPGLNLKQRVER